jgi:alkaline phosphatase
MSFNFPGGLIDQAHHATIAKKGLEETLVLHETVNFVRSQIDEKDTLMLVTADHSHVFTVGGYPVIQNRNIFENDLFDEISAQRIQHIFISRFFARRWQTFLYVELC